MTNEQEPDHLPESFWSRCRHALLGPARNIYDPALGHHVLLVAFLAWIGLGADGLSSSAYGPDEAFRALEGHVYLAPFLMLATAGTVFIISFAYSRIIEHFPEGGGGYIVATKLLGNSAGVVSGSALLVDYVLTITVSIAAGGDAIFSLLPLAAQKYKIALECGVILFLTVMNLRGIKESVTLLVPIFLLFLFNHLILIGYGVFSNLGSIGHVVETTGEALHTSQSSIGKWGLLLIFLRAYCMGGGTYTGIEAVSNGLGILREPKAETGKKTMVYMATSLAVTAGGLLLAYMLSGVTPVLGQTLNATLADRLFGHFVLFNLPLGHWFVWLIMFSAAVLLVVAAQTGFIDGPRVMANMASDRWLPRRFAALSDRLTTQSGVILMSVAAMATLAYTRGNIQILVVMYSINVFLTFSLSQLGMCRFWLQKTRTHPFFKWTRNFFLHGVGFVLCAAILLVMVFEKIREGGWVTVVVTVALILLCVAIRRHYHRVYGLVQEMGETLADIPLVPAGSGQIPPLNPSKPTAAILVGGGHSRTALHTLLTVFRLFPNTFHNVVFLSVGVINSDFFKGEHGVGELEQKTQEALCQYVDLARGLGIPAQAAFRVGTDIVAEAADLCVQVSKEFPGVVFFGSELVFQEPRWYHRFLHNETAYSIQRRLRFAGLSVVILPILLFEKPSTRSQDIRDFMIYRGVKYKQKN